MAMLAVEDESKGYELLHLKMVASRCGESN